MADSLAERLEAVRGALGLSQQQFANRLNTAISTYQRYASGQSGTIKSEQLEVLKGLGVDLNWLICGEGSAFIGEASGAVAAEGQEVAAAPIGGHLVTADHGRAPEPPEGFVLVPRYDIEASAGAGMLAGAENVLDYMAFQESWVRRALRVDPSRLALITASGDSMEPAIRPGDLLLVDLSVETVMDDSIYLVALNDFLLVKRVQKLLRGLVVKSDNPNYLTMTLGPEEAEELRIRGRIRWIGRLI